MIISGSTHKATNIGGKQLQTTEMTLQSLGIEMHIPGAQEDADKLLLKSEPTLKP